MNKGEAAHWYLSYKNMVQQISVLLRTCVFLRRHHTFPRQLLEWSMRSAVTYRAVMLMICFNMIEVMQPIDVVLRRDALTDP